MKLCLKCGKEVQNRNKSGYCAAHVNAARGADWRAKISATMRRKFAQDPVFAEQKRAVARRLSDDPDIVARRTVGFDQTIRDRGLKAAHSPEARAKAGRTLTANRLAWCPAHLRAEYLSMVRRHLCTAAEARRMIEAQHEMEMARWRRSVGIEIAPTPFEPVHPSEPDLTPVERAIELVAHRCQITIGKLFSDERHGHLIRARAALALAMKRQGCTLSKTAQAMHKADHTTALNWVRKGEHLVGGDPHFAALVDELTACWHQLEVAA